MVYSLLTIAVSSLVATVETPSAPAESTHGPLERAVLVEAEAFDELGGWVLDQQFMDLMGSPFLLAHGMGVPVADATTEVEVAAPGPMRVWVRTRDWVAPWGAPGAPGRFQVLVDGEPLETTFGVEGDPWHWQDGGVVDVGARVRLGLHDLTGFEGRCDAILLAPAAEDWVPPDGGGELEELRRALLGIPKEPADGGHFDLVVVGGGTAGTSAAVTAARLGLKVALIQDRPVLGGNSSSEVRVWPQGHVNQQPYPRVGDVVMELMPERRSDSKNAQSAHVFDDDRKLRVVRAEPNITLMLGRRMNGAEVTEGAIRSVVCEDTRLGGRTRVSGDLFLDSTGDGGLGYLAGASFEQTDTGHMGASNLWNIQCLCEDEDPLSSELAVACEEATFPRCPWAVDLSERPFPGRTWGSTEPEPGASPISIGNWYWENGFDRDPIADMERIRDQNFRAAYGAWDAIKNVEKRYPAHRLNWVAYIAGKRESRRLIGDVILTGKDLRGGVKFEDGCFPCTWGIDTHYADTRYAEGHEGDEFIARATQGEGYVYEGPYWVPYRCLYSRNIGNLFMAGRDISVTHEALGAVRVMKTTGAMGEIVGMAASLCQTNECSPRAVYAEHLDELKALMSRGAGRLQGHSAIEDGSVRLPARTATVQGRSVRYEPALDVLGYWRRAGESVAWDALPADAGRFDVVLEVACNTGDGGGQVAVQVGVGDELVDVVPDTGGWDRFVDLHVGEVQLDGGAVRVEVIDRKEAGPLMKLRAVRLVPLP